MTHIITHAIPIITTIPIIPIIILVVTSRIVQTQHLISYVRLTHTFACDDAELSIALADCTSA